MSRNRPAAGAADAAVYEDFAPRVAHVPSRNFPFTKLGADFLTHQAIVSESSNADVNAYAQLSSQQKEKLRVASVRAVLLRGLSGKHSVSATEIKKAIPSGGDFGNVAFGTTCAHENCLPPSAARSALTPTPRCRRRQVPPVPRSARAGKGVWAESSAHVQDARGVCVAFNSVVFCRELDWATPRVTSLHPCPPVCRRRGRRTV